MGHSSTPVALDESDSDPLSFNGNIGHFGVGAQNSAFFLADEELVITRQSGEPVRELLLSKQTLKDDYTENPQAAYSKSVQRRPPSEAARSALRPDAHPVLLELLEAERGRPSFCLMVLSGIKPHHRADLERLKAGPLRPGAPQRPMALAEMPFLRQVRARLSPPCRPEGDIRTLSQHMHTLLDALPPPGPPWGRRTRPPSTARKSLPLPLAY